MRKVKNDLIEVPVCITIREIADDLGTRVALKLHRQAQLDHGLRA